MLESSAILLLAMAAHVNLGFYVVACVWFTCDKESSVMCLSTACSSPLKKE